jgi:anti-sigma-K factor RskA
MTTGREAETHDDRRDDLAAYALGALDEAEAGELETHLASCVECRRYLEELRGGVDLLAASAPQLPPPPALRERLVATVNEEAVRIAEAARPAAPTRRRWRSWRGLAARPATAMAAALALITGAAVGYFVHGSSGPGRSVIPADPTPAAPPGVVRASLARVDGSATLAVKRMPPLPGRDVYEVWTQRGSALRPESTFVLRRDGTANAAVPDLTGASAVLVTREPRGGSQHPTSPPLLRASL